MINRFLLSIAILLIPIKFFGQTKFHLDLSGTYSFIPKTEMTDESTFIGGLIKYSEEFKVKPGLNIGIGFNKKLVKNFSIHSGLGLSYIQFKRVFHVEIEESKMAGEPYGPIGNIDYIPGGFRFMDTIPNTTNEADPNLGKTKILYLSIPVKFQYAIIPEKFRMELGVTNYFIIYSSQIKSTYDLSGPPFAIITYNDKSSNGLNNYQLHGNINLEFKLLKGFWIYTGYNHGFLRIYDKPAPDGFASSEFGHSKYRSAELGLKFELNKIL